MNVKDIPVEAYNGLVFAVENIEACLASKETDVLWEAHWLETEGYRESQGYCPDRPQYIFSERHDGFLYFTARHDGRLVGHLGYLIHKSRHTSKLNAVEDFFYFSPDARQGFTAINFMRYAVRVLKACGCKQIGMSSKLTNDIEPLLKRAGFEYVAKFFVLNVET